MILNHGDDKVTQHRKKLETMKKENMKLAKDLDIAVSPRMSEVKKPLPKIKK